MAPSKQLSFKTVHQFLDGLFGEDIHAKRVYSLANATLGVISSASLAVNTIGQGLALARGGMTKHAVKQVDRLLSNPGIELDGLCEHWVPYVIGARDRIAVAMDWTDFDADNQATIMLSLITRHGRTTPLVWMTVQKDSLKNQRNNYEYAVLRRLSAVLPANVKVLIVADRGFGDQKLYRFLTEELKFDYVIRFRGNIMVTAADGETRPAADWVGAGGRARTLRNAAVTVDRYQVGTVVCVRAKGMKDAWCLAAKHDRGDRQDADQSLRQALGRGMRVPRRQGYSLRHGNGFNPRQRAGATRSSLAAQRLCDRPSDLAGIRWRGARF